MCHFRDFTLSIISAQPCNPAAQRIIQTHTCTLCTNIADKVNKKTNYMKTCTSNDLCFVFMEPVMVSLEKLTFKLQFTFYCGLI